MAFFAIIGQYDFCSGNLDSKLTSSFGDTIALFFNEVDQFDSFLSKVNLTMYEILE